MVILTIIVVSIVSISCLHPRYDFTNVADACCTLDSLRVTGSVEPLGSSQLVPNQLPIDFLAFKSLSRLQLDQLELGRPAGETTITSLGILRTTLRTLAATRCGLAAVSQLLLCDVAHSAEELPAIITSPALSWSHLLHLDLR